MKTLESYRPEIDGLRGLSVLCVVLYHTNLSFFKKIAPGSFVALDIFFVISGYLITESIIRRRDNFSFKRFYIRRAKRLYPALFLTISSSLALGSFLFPPGRVESLAKSGLFSLLCVSNIYFGLNTDYFSYEAMFEVFLHNWSLSLEEQFYFLYPVLLILFLKKSPTAFKAFLIFLSIAILSIGLGEYYLAERAKFTYYLLPFRAYELMAGAMVCFLPRLNIHKNTRELWTSLGGLLILYSYLGLSARDTFPGLNSIYPTLGTFLLLYFGKGTKFNKILFDWSVIKAIGASCYSIYLFHWPIFVFFRYLTLEKSLPFAYIFLSVISVSLGCLSWFKLEKNLLSIPENSEKETRFLKWSFISFCALSLICLLLYFSKGLPDRYPKTISKPHSTIVKERRDYWDNVSKHFTPTPEILFVGNSHAVDLIYMFKENGLELQIDQIDTTFRCHHFIFPIRYWHRDFCSDIESKIFNYPELSKVKRIYLHDYWWKIDQKLLEKFLRTLSKKAPGKIYLFGPKMAYKYSLIDLFQISRIRSSSFEKLLEQDQMSERIKINKKAKALVKGLKGEGIEVEFVDLLKLQCGASYSRCEVISPNGELYYFDDSHFNILGARNLGSKLKNSRPSLFY